MSNQYTHKVMAIDTPGGSLPGIREIIAVVWASKEGNLITTNSDFLVTDGAGVPLVGKRAACDGDDLGLAPCQPLIVQGIIVEVLDSGVCYIWLS